MIKEKFNVKSQKLKVLFLRNFSFLILFAFISLITGLQFRTTQAAQNTTAPTLTSAAINSSASAVTEPTNTVIDKLKKIESLKEKIATKVAQIRENEKAAYFGLVKKTDKSNITLEQNMTEKIIPVSEDTLFYTFTAAGKSETSFSKLSQNAYISAFGYLDDSKTVFSAKYIYLEKPLNHIIGKIADIDKTNYTITVKSPEGDTTVDIETSTKISIYTLEKGLQKTGFSKLRAGDIVHITGSKNEKETNRITGLRIIDIGIFNQIPPTLTGNPTQSPAPKQTKTSVTPASIKSTP